MRELVQLSDEVTLYWYLRVAEARTVVSRREREGERERE